VGSGAALKLPGIPAIDRSDLHNSMKRSILDRYILKTHIGPYFFGLSIITFIFIMDFIFRYLDLFIGKGVDFFVVLEFFVLSLGHMFALIIPMAVMPATLMAFGQLSSDNEVTAMKASGVSLYRMILPVIVASVLLTIGLIIYNNELLPESNHRLMNLMIDIGRMKPTLELKENQFNDSIKGFNIYFREKDDKTGRITDVWISENKKGGIPTTTAAARGRMIYLEKDNILRFELEDGEIHEMPDPRDITTYRKTEFRNFTLNVYDTDRDLKRTDRAHRGDREMSAAMMRDKIEDIRANMDAVRDHMHEIAVKHYVNAIAPAFPELGDLAPGDVPRPRAPQPQSREERIRRAREPAEKVIRLLENEMTILDQNLNQIYRYEVEIHKKYSIPFSCIIFVLLGAPLAIRSGKKGMTMSIGFSIFFFLIYYIFLIGGEKLADRKYVSPLIAMWTPNILLVAIAVFLIHRTVREVQTINWNRLNLLKRLRRGSAEGNL
jgi:lipopolysaccharide export system permease protein